MRPLRTIIVFSRVNNNKRVVEDALCSAWLELRNKKNYIRVYCCVGNIGCYYHHDKSYISDTPKCGSII